MIRRMLALFFLGFSTISLSQEKSLNVLLADSLMEHASVSFCILTCDSGNILFEYNSEKSLVPASTLKLITSAAALELLGPEYKFRTEIGYTGKLNKRSGRLDGNIIIKGGGDPVLGSKNFGSYYEGFAGNWVKEIKDAGIRKISGQVITDDSYFDYQPVPAKWLWEDAGNYYGAGAYGLSVYDNTYEIHFRTSADSMSQEITGIEPVECGFEFSNWLVAAGTADKGYVFAAPYSTNGWLSGTIPANLDDFVLKASIADPPMIMAKVLDQKLRSAGVTIGGSPTTCRLQRLPQITDVIHNITGIDSPPLREIIEVLNHESVNLYAEHLTKELGKVYLKSGTTESGVRVMLGFLELSGVNTSGMFIEDGSGLSPLDAINARGLAVLLLYMKKAGKYFDDFYNSLPEPGKEGTLKSYFMDPVFETRMAAKSGSMTRARSYAGYLTAFSGKELAFSIIVNNFEGQHREIIRLIEDIIGETIQNN
jgi:D-alanyl-D-alanine carboxypeptidase/D-alanyl-D-alanine-endopeptidase (penicillin-binding protein 4)